MLPYFTYNYFEEEDSEKHSGNNSAGLKDVLAKHVRIFCVPLITKEKRKKDGNAPSGKPPAAQHRRRHPSNLHRGHTQHNSGLHSFTCHSISYSGLSNPKDRKNRDFEIEHYISCCKWSRRCRCDDIHNSSACSISTQFRLCFAFEL